MVSAVLDDLRHAWRGVRRMPVVSLVIVASLALGIGVNAALDLRPMDPLRLGYRRTGLKTAPDSWRYLTPNGRCQ